MQRDERPVVSVIMPAYNAEKYIEEAIQSVLCQTMSDLELLVIDDGSKDHTVQIVSDLAKEDARIRLIINEENMGVAKTRNRGLSLSRGAYVALLDSDDAWHPKKLEKQVKLAKETNADLLYTSYALVSETGKKTYQDFVTIPTVTFDQMLLENQIGCSTVMFSREIADKYRFSETFYHEDYVLWLTILRDGYKAAGLTETLVYWRVMETSRSSNKFHSAKKRWMIYRGFLGYSVLKSGILFLRYAMAGIQKYMNKGR